jgi:branched-chain amino acid aminotransferase
MMYGYINGAVQPVAQMALGLSDLGILRGHGLFDYMRTYHGQLFQWDLYWARLSHSAAVMQLSLPFMQDEMYRIIMDLLVKSDVPDAAIRTVVTGGYSLDSMTVTKPNVMIMVEPLPVVPVAQYEHGIHVILDDYVRDMADVKTTDYKHVILLASHLAEKEAQDVLYHKNGVISELSRSNVFLVKGHTLITPDRDILRGITRQVVMDIARSDFIIEERAVSIDEVWNADEIFTTSSNKKILPITRVDGHIIADGEVGPCSRHLLAQFNALTEILRT